MAEAVVRTLSIIGLLQTAYGPVGGASDRYMSHGPGPRSILAAVQIQHCNVSVAWSSGAPLVGRRTIRHERNGALLLVCRCDRLRGICANSGRVNLWTCGPDGVSYRSSCEDAAD